MDRLPAARRFVRRFVAGPALEDALGVAARLNAAGVDAAITHLGENVATTDDAARAADAYLEVLAEIGRRRLRAVPSLKLTHLGLDLGDAVCRENLERVAARGLATRTLVWVDMESSAYTDRTLELYRRLHPTYSNLACVVQSYLRRTAQDVERLIEIGATVRLCKGAYREPPAIAFPDKRDVDASYARLLDRLLSADALARGVYPAFATHDERLIARAREKAKAGGVTADRYEIQMLYGIRHDLHATLGAAGSRLRVLIPYGEDWYGYFVRRLAERPANLAFLFRQLLRG
ncbi:MAG: proline dehydrogenase [Candidatus Rokuibacteriota bacterium]|nr:MAG: proline dehydrogenase [Candidatus Rokubacteria bacterium]